MGLDRLEGAHSLANVDCARPPKLGQSLGCGTDWLSTYAVQTPGSSGRPASPTSRTTPDAHPQLKQACSMPAQDKLWDMDIKPHIRIYEIEIEGQNLGPWHSPEDLSPLSPQALASRQRFQADAISSEAASDSWKGDSMPRLPSAWFTCGVTIIGAAASHFCKRLRSRLASKLILGFCQGLLSALIFPAYVFSDHPASRGWRFFGGGRGVADFDDRFCHSVISIIAMIQSRLTGSARLEFFGIPACFLQRKPFAQSA